VSRCRPSSTRRSGGPTLSSTLAIGFDYRELRESYGMFTSRSAADVDEALDAKIARATLDDIAHRLEAAHADCKARTGAGLEPGLVTLLNLNRPDFGGGSDLP
jgi:hypothetical protein